jgi:hypothetical protein
MKKRQRYTLVSAEMRGKRTARIDVEEDSLFFSIDVGSAPDVFILAMMI